MEANNVVVPATVPSWEPRTVRFDDLHDGVPVIVGADDHMGLAVLKAGDGGACLSAAMLAGGRESRCGCKGMWLHICLPFRQLHHSVSVARQKAPADTHRGLAGRRIDLRDRLAFLRGGGGRPDDHQQEHVRRAPSEYRLVPFGSARGRGLSNHE